MNIVKFRLLSDFHRVHTFLTENYDLTHLNSYYLPQFFEYALTHPLFSFKEAHRMMIIEENNEMIGFIAIEMTVPETFVVLKQEYLSYFDKCVTLATQHMSVVKDNIQISRIWVIDHEIKKNDILKERGFKPIYEEAVTIFKYGDPLKQCTLAQGYEFFSLCQENDIEKIDECLHKGFDHKKESDKDFDSRLMMQTGPNFSKELSTIVKAENGDYATYAGMWLDKYNHYAYLEPLATMPNHRKKGLASAIIAHSIEKTKQLGATYMFGGDMPFYYNFGFKKIATRILYEKRKEIT